MELRELTSRVRLIHVPLREFQPTKIFLEHTVAIDEAFFLPLAEEGPRRRVASLWKEINFGGGAE